MNLKQIKDAARKAFSDQQSQDTEGGVPDAISFCAGFLAGARHLGQMFDRAELVSTNDDKIKEVELREVRANRLVVDLARQLTNLQSAFDDRVRVIEMQLEDKKKLEFENERLREIISFYENRKGEE